MKFRPIATVYELIDEWGHLPEAEKARGIKVEWRGAGTWAVTVGHSCLNSDGDWEFEPHPSRQDNAFIQRCTFSLHDALIMAARKAGVELTDDPL